MKNDYRKTIHGNRRFSNPKFYTFTVWLQNILQKIGVNWHNSYSDECCKDFKCCNK